MAFTTIPFDLLGFRVMGDLNGLTCYTDKHGRKIFYEKSPPKKPPSPKQVVIRNRFRLAVLAWKALSTDDKLVLEEAVRRTSLCLTGQNLYTSCSLRSSEGVYQTVASQAGLALPNLAVIP